jgi:hypothetical protein|tara:strand:- start:1529 stop:1945 length:417 start_codon:yes stop_codon:yes gene_type:complete
MLPPNEWDTSAQVLAGTLSTPLIVFVIQKVITFWKNESSTQAGVDATVKQFKSLQDAIDATNKALSETRAEVAVMDKITHRQQRTITRMEMLLRQLVGFIHDHQFPIPPHIQKEYADLLRETDHNSNAKARGSGSATP